MGLADRHYYRDQPKGPSGRMRPPMGGWSVNTWIIVINTAVFLLQAFRIVPVIMNPKPTSFFPPGAADAFWYFGHFSTAEAFFLKSGNVIHLNLQVWRLVTFQFLHADMWHLFFNMFGLYVFGGMVEQYLGRKRYLAFYLICGIFGGLMYLLLNLLGQSGLSIPGVLVNDPRTPLVGASAGVFGVILACAYLAPNAKIMLLFPPIPLPLKVFAYGYVAIAIVMLLAGTRNAGGQAAHIGGAIAGAFFIRRSYLLRDFFDVFGPKGRPGKRPGRGRSEVDRILDKVNNEGLQSLSERERRILRDETASRRDGA